MCAEWDFGGHPWWLLKDNVKLRSTDEKHLNAIKNFINKVADEIYDF